MLSSEQELHNLMNKLELEKYELEHQQKEEEARLKNQWFRANFPDAPEEVKELYGINMCDKQRVCQIIYID